VYFGLDLGSAVAAPVFGALLDRGMPSGVFYGSAHALALGIISAGWVGVGISRRQSAQPLS